MKPSIVVKTPPRYNRMYRTDGKNLRRLKGTGGNSNDRFLSDVVALCYCE